MKLNVLFVDDEIMVLDALRRSLRSQASDWNMHFADSVDECWNLLEAEDFDVVVTDMQMPGVDGSAFLATLRARMPGTVRMVLSGFKDRQTAVQTDSAHRFLMKPIMATSLVRHISSATSRPLSEEIRKMVRGTPGLVTTAATKNQLAVLLASPETEILAVARVVENDPGLCAKVLQLANSSVFGLRNPELDIETCLAAMQVESLRTMITNDKLLWSFPAGDAREATVQALIDHARSLAASAEDQPARIAAMLHVAGSLLEVRNGITTGSDCHCERSTDLSLDLLQLWGLPTAAIEALQQFGSH